MTDELMVDSSHLWILFTLIAAAAQTLRNAAQRQLTASIGTAGATQVRFLFGAPFGLLFLVIVWIATEAPLPHPPPVYWLWILLGGLAQTFATALMLMAMSDRSFVVVYAYIKTEPVQVALFGLILLGDHVSLPMAVAILIATAGVIVMSRGVGEGGIRPTLLGLAAGGLFGLSAIGFRGGILTLTDTNYAIAASYSALMGLVLQAILLSIYLWLRSPGVMTLIMRQWRPSLVAGFLGAFASLFWFLSFALATAASVRTLALVEVLFAQAVSIFGFKQKTTLREGIGIVLIVVGVALLVRAA
jgi:drug/metabolite transporter (DMT)-like permease